MNDSIIGNPIVMVFLIACVLVFFITIIMLVHWVITSIHEYFKARKKKGG